MSTIETTPIKFPGYAKTTILLIGLYVFISILSIAQDLILPLVYGIIVAILISPMVNFLVQKKMNRAVAISSVLMLFLLIVIVLISLVVAQLNSMSESLPQLTLKFEELFKHSVQWVSGCLDISVNKINTWLSEKRSEVINNSGSVIGPTLTTMTGALATIFLTPVYIFMILLYEPHLIRFSHHLFGATDNEKVKEISSETKTIVQSYLVGLLSEFAIIAVLNSIGLMVLGIKYAILLGIIGAFLNIIPYIGGIIGVFIFAIVALITKSPVYVLYVIALYTLIQFIDNNYIVPKIVGSKVKLNALISLLAVIAGAALWGIPGMFLSIPITAIIKVVFDHSESMKAWGYLLGDSLPPLLRMKGGIRKNKASV